jgi:hypothetical protein
MRSIMPTLQDFLNANNGNKIFAAAQMAYGLSAFSPSDPYRQGYSREASLLYVKDAFEIDDATMKLVGSAFDIAMRNEPSPDEQRAAQEAWAAARAPRRGGQSA